MNDREDDIEFIHWAKAVKVRDNFECSICESRGYLESHHLNSWNAYPDERLDLENGTCLCSYHHHAFHKIYGYGDNTKWQFEQYKQTLELFEKLLKSEKPPEIMKFGG